MLVQGGGNEQRVSVKDEMLLFQILLIRLVVRRHGPFFYILVYSTATLDYSSLSLSLCQRAACCAAVLEAEHGPDLIRRVLLLETRGCVFHSPYFFLCFSLVGVDS